MLTCHLYCIKRCRSSLHNKTANGLKWLKALIDQLTALLLFWTSKGVGIASHNYSWTGLLLMSKLAKTALISPLTLLIKYIDVSLHVRQCFARTCKHQLERMHCLHQTGCMLQRNHGWEECLSGGPVFVSTVCKIRQPNATTNTSLLSGKKCLEYSVTAYQNYINKPSKWFNMIQHINPVLLADLSYEYTKGKGIAA